MWKKDTLHVVVETIIAVLRFLKKIKNRTYDLRIPLLSIYLMEQLINEHVISGSS